jgi:methylmalonyl-CoA/ethylmalonyl-CoA epimerase
LRLHHVGILVRDISSAAELYSARYGYQLKSGIIHDPVQGASVQFLELPGDPVFLEFISPDSPESHLSNALNKGGGVHHVCYAIDDMDMRCEELRRQGMTLVRPPVAAVAFGGRRVAWLMGRDRALVELVEKGSDGAI